MLDEDWCNGCAHTKPHPCRETPSWSSVAPSGQAMFKTTAQLAQVKKFLCKRFLMSLSEGREIFQLTFIHTHARAHIHTHYFKELIELTEQGLVELRGRLRLSL